MMSAMCVWFRRYIHDANCEGMRRGKGQKPKLDMSNSAGAAAASLFTARRIPWNAAPPGALESGEGAREVRLLGMLMSRRVERRRSERRESRGVDWVA